MARQRLLRHLPRIVLYLHLAGAFAAFAFNLFDVGAGPWWLVRLARETSPSTWFPWVGPVLIAWGMSALLLCPLLEFVLFLTPLVPQPNAWAYLAAGAGCTVVTVLAMAPACQ